MMLTLFTAGFDLGVLQTEHFVVEGLLTMVQTLQVHPPTIGFEVARVDISTLVVGCVGRVVDEEEAEGLKG